MADISKINPNGTEYDIKDAVARGMVEGSKTATGNPITLTDASESYAEELEVTLEPIQAGSGTPSPSNIRPITGYTEVSVGSVGKNLADYSLEGYYDVSNNGAFIANSSWIATPLIELLSGKNYILSKGASVFTVVLYYDGNKDFISSSAITSSTTYSISAPPNTKYIAVYGREQNLQLELGQTATSFEPYKSSSATISFGQEVFGGKSDFTNGGTDSELAYTTINDLSLTRNPDNGLFYVTLSDAKPPASNNDLAGMFSSCYGEVVYNRISLDDGSIALSTAKLFVIKDTRYTSVTDLKNAMGTQQICYVKATPTNIATPPTDLKLLDGQNTVTTNGTTISLKYQPDNVIGEAIGVSEKYTDKKVNGKIYTKTVTGTVWVNGQSARMLILYNDSTAWDKIPIAAFYSTYKCTPYYVYENDTYTWGILIHKSDGTNATDISSGASITMEVVYMDTV